MDRAAAYGAGGLAVGRAGGEEERAAGQEVAGEDRERSARCSSRVRWKKLSQATMPPKRRPRSSPRMSASIHSACGKRARAIASMAAAKSTPVTGWPRAIR